MVTTAPALGHRIRHRGLGTGVGTAQPRAGEAQWASGNRYAYWGRRIWEGVTNRGVDKGAGRGFAAQPALLTLYLLVSLLAGLDVASFSLSRGLTSSALKRGVSSNLI